MVNTEWLNTVRDGMHVQRTHTHRTIGEYTVGFHSIGAIAIAYELLKHNDADENKVIRKLFSHDIAEYYTGDNPTHPKIDCPELKKVLDALEEKWAATNIPEEFHVELTSLEKKLVKASDLLEFMFWAIEQMEMGNSLMARQYVKAMKYVKDKELEEIIGVSEILDSLDNRNPMPIPDEVFIDHD